LPRASVIDVRSPLVAAQLAHEDHGSAAIVPESCGRAAELEVARANVGDAPDLRFRYALATLRPASRSGSDTTCLLFSVDNATGALFDVLRHFAERGINLKKLQSTPVRSEGWDYVFYVEVGGHVTDRPVVTALEAVKRSTKYLKVLGSFPTER
jgi:chorismate mutase/prephenate dehydratase